MNWILNPTTDMVIFFTMLIAAAISALLILHPRIPLSYVRQHVRILIFPPVAAIFALFSGKATADFGPWHVDSLSWLLASFVLTIGLLIQRFSIRHLLGNRAYRAYFALFTFTTISASLAWISGDVRFISAFFGGTLLGLYGLIRLNFHWKIVNAAARRAGIVFMLSWVTFTFSVFWLFLATDSWNLASALSPDALAAIPSWQKTGMNVLLVIAVIIPAAQWPFHKWLIESAVAPTPVSAIMHAGLVNAGGILLTRFSPLFSGDIAAILLVLLSGVSVLIGVGISLVQVDYKRQLVGSTMAQMGFMLIQCALGAYEAAIIHLVLHGLFKATLFLQAGFAVKRIELPLLRQDRMTRFLLRIGQIASVLVAVAFWWQLPENSYQWISAIILGWSLSIAWTQLVAFGAKGMGRVAGIALMAAVAVLYWLIHKAFANMLASIAIHHQSPSLVVSMIVLVLLVGGGLIGWWLVHHPESRMYPRVYLRLVKFGEAANETVDSHPSYLKEFIDEGGDDYDRDGYPYHI